MVTGETDIMAGYACLLVVLGGEHVRRAEVLFRRVLAADRRHCCALLGYASLLAEAGGSLQVRNRVKISMER